MDSKLYYDLFTASSLGSLLAIEMCLIMGANVSAYNNEALRQAVINGQLDACKLLVKNGADTSRNFAEVMIYAEYYNHTKIVQYLKEALREGDHEKIWYGKLHCRYNEKL